MVFSFMEGQQRQVVVDEADDDNEDSKLSNIFTTAYCNILYLSVKDEVLESQAEVFCLSPNLFSLLLDTFIRCCNV